MRLRDTAKRSQQGIEVQRPLRISLGDHFEGSPPNSLEVWISVFRK